jgi:G3E family GTPase
MSDSGPIPITLLTGYLGSGKTTLLAYLLKRPELHETLVLVNEFGEIALDHELLYAGSEAVMLLGQGCLCCAATSELADQLDQLYTARMRKELPAFERVVIETTGLADPAPILQALVAQPALAALYRLDAVVATVDAQLGMRELDRYFEAVKQVALADRIVLTKIDLAQDDVLATLQARLQALNPTAPIVRSQQGEVEPRFLFDAGYAGAARRPERIEEWLEATRYLPMLADAAPSVFPGAQHDRRIHAFTWSCEAPVSGAALWAELEALIERHGEKLLRVKGIVNVQGQSAPRVIHIVQHVLYPVLTLPSWPSADRRTRLVFIARDLQPEAIRNQLQRAAAATH